MRYSNKHGLEPVFQWALEKKKYDKGNCDFSITELLQPPRARRLIEMKGAEHSVDISTQVQASLGTGFHMFAELGARPIDICEKRFFGKFGEWTVSAQIDFLYGDTLRLIDWKTAKAYPFTDKGGKGQKTEWIFQTNGQAEILRQNGIFPKSLHIVGVIKDFDYNGLDLSSRKYMKGYPKHDLWTVDMPIWESEIVREEVLERIHMHVKAQKELPQCSSSESWGGNRCARFCDAQYLCTQYEKAIKTGLME